MKLTWSQATDCMRRKLHVVAEVCGGLQLAYYRPLHDASLASSPVHSSARLLGTVGGAVTFAVRHLEKEALPSRYSQLQLCSRVSAAYYVPFSMYVGT